MEHNAVNFLTRSATVYLDSCIVTLGSHVNNVFRIYILHSSFYIVLFSIYNPHVFLCFQLNSYIFLALCLHSIFWHILYLAVFVTLWICGMKMQYNTIQYNTIQYNTTSATHTKLIPWSDSAIVYPQQTSRCSQKHEFQSAQTWRWDQTIWSSANRKTTSQLNDRDCSF